MAQTFYTHCDSPLGELLLTSTGAELQGLYLFGQKYFPRILPEWLHQSTLELFQQVESQLQEYFQQQRRTFDIPLAPLGTDFQQQVWQQLPLIPYGETISYGELSRRVGLPNGARAVGAANGRNPISIIVPCHRVVASSGKMQGYAGGIDRKQWLLRHEGKPVETMQLSLLS